MALTGCAIELVDMAVAPFGVSVVLPRDGAGRGRHVALVDLEARAVAVVFAARRGDHGGFCARDVIGLGLSRLRGTFAEGLVGVGGCPGAVARIGA